MKALNKTATGIFQAAIDRIEEGETSVKLDAGDQENGGGIMALHVEKIRENKYGDLYSFAHYYEQNGDMMRDPDVVMLRTTEKAQAIWHNLDTGTLFPLSYRQDGLGIDREYVIFNEDGDGWKIARKMQADLVSFCNGWSRNLKEQQGLKPAKRENKPVLHCSPDVAAWLDNDGGLQKAGLMKVDDDSTDDTNADYHPGILIASSPDLLQALKDAKQVLETAKSYFPKSIKNRDNFHLLNVLANSVEPAIAKAEGHDTRN